MLIPRSLHLALAGAIALALCGTAAVAQVPPPPPPPAAPTPPAPPMAPPPPATPMPPPPPAVPMAPQVPSTAMSRFYHGTETTATYPLPDSHGGTLTVHAGMPAHVKQYGPPPAFSVLDTNHDGKLSELEAEAYPPLDSDFLLASQHGQTISKAQYDAWVAGLK